MEVREMELAEKDWLTFAHWVGDASELMRGDNPTKISLADSSIPEPTDMLAATVSQAFEFGMPESYQSVFLRSNPALVQILSARYDVAIEHIHCTTGATSAIQLLYCVLLKPGDEVLIEKPGFDIFSNFALRSGLEVDYFDRPSPSFKVDIEAVLAKLKRNTKMVVVSNSHNPSGVLLADAEISELATRLQKRNIYLLVDEVYRDYGESFLSSVDVIQHPNLVRIGSLTKNFGLSALRCGWVFASREVVDGIRSHFSNTDFSVSKVAHSIAAEVLLRQSNYDSWRQEHLEAARPVAQSILSQLVEEGLIELEFPPHACVCFPRISGVENTVALSKWLLHKFDVVVVPGECFGISGHMRIGYGGDVAELQEGLGRFAAGLRLWNSAATKPKGTK